jgi:hypothetical protein
MVPKDPYRGTTVPAPVRADLRALFVVYARLYRAHPGGAELVARLADDERMLEAWQMFCEHAREPDGRPIQAAGSALMWAIVEAWGVGKHIRGVPNAQRDIKAERDRLIDCAETLREAFALLAGPDPDSEPDPGGKPPVRGPRRRAWATMAEACRRASYELDGLEGAQLARLARLPTPHQRNDPAVTFAVMVGNAIERITGKPLDKVVADITSAAFGLEIDAEAVKQGRSRDRNRGSVSRP